MNDPVQALNELLEAWRETRHPALAELIDTVSAHVGQNLAPLALGQEPWLDLAIAGRACDVPQLVNRWLNESLTLVKVRARVDRLAQRPDDPRIGLGLARYVEDFPRTYSAKNAAWTALVKLILRTGDVRCVAVLQARGTWQRRLQPDVVRICETLAARPVPEVDVTALRQSVAALLAKPAPTREAVLEASETASALDEEELLRRICQSPADDTPRLVYGDFLTERGDPRGELIALQFKKGRTARDDKRMRALLRAHMPEWLGAIEPAVEPSARVFARGFLSEGRVRFQSAAQKRTLLTHPLWNTLEVLASNPEPLEDFLRACPLLGLRKIGPPINADLLARLATRPAPWPRLEELTLRTAGAEPALLRTMEAPTSMPRLTRLTLSGDDGYDWLISSALGRRLTSLRLWSRTNNVREWLLAAHRLEALEFGVAERIAFSRTATGWNARVSCDYPLKPYVATVLPPLRDLVQRVELDRGHRPKPRDDAARARQQDLDRRFDEITQALKGFEIIDPRG